MKKFTPRIKNILKEGGLVLAPRGSGKTTAIMQILEEDPYSVVVTPNMMMAEAYRRELKDKIYPKRICSRSPASLRGLFCYQPNIYLDEYFLGNYQGPFKGAVASKEDAKLEIFSKKTPEHEVKTKLLQGKRVVYPLDYSAFGILSEIVHEEPESIVVLPYRNWHLDEKMRIIGIPSENYCYANTVEPSELDGRKIYVFDSFRNNYIGTFFSSIGSAPFAVHDVEEDLLNLDSFTE